MGRKSLKDKRQREIVRAYYKLSKRMGYDRVSIAKLAQTMDMHPSLILHYFDSKDKLNEALVDYILDRYSTIFKLKNPAMVGKEDLDEIINRLFSKKWDQLFDDGLFYGLYAETFRSQDIKKQYKSLLDALRSELADILIRLMESRQLDLQDPHQAANRLFILLDGAYFYLSLVDDPIQYEQSMSIYCKEAKVILGLIK